MQTGRSWFPKVQDAKSKATILQAMSTQTSAACTLHEVGTFGHTVLYIGGTGMSVYTHTQSTIILGHNSTGFLFLSKWPV